MLWHFPSSVLTVPKFTPTLMFVSECLYQTFVLGSWADGDLASFNKGFELIVFRQVWLQELLYYYYYYNDVYYYYPLSYRAAPSLQL